ncbi:MAG: helix-turn-helix transcriptional regulator [Verrucomicrobiota bacterium]
MMAPQPINKIRTGLSIDTNTIDNQPVRRCSHSEIRAENSDFSSFLMILSRASNQFAGFFARPSPAAEALFAEAGEIWAGKDWQIDWHANPGWEVYLQIGGSSLWEAEGGLRFQLKQGGCYLISPTHRHRLIRFSELSHFAFVVIPEARLPEDLKGAHPWTPGVKHGEHGGDLLPLFRGLVGEVARDRRWQTELCRHYLAALAYAATRTFEAPESENSKPIPAPRSSLKAHPGAVRARQLLGSRLEYPWNMTELARLCGVSRGHLIDLYRREYGETPIRSLKRFRIEEAERLLRTTDLPVTEIAHALHFSSSQHLSRDFRAHTGTSPRAFRAAACR